MEKMKISIFLKSNAKGLKYQEADIAAVIEVEHKGKKAVKSIHDTVIGTINKIDMSNMLMALKELKPPDEDKHDITIYMDNEYIGGSINANLLPGWSVKGFKKKGGEAMANASEWQQLYIQCNTHNIYCVPYEDKYDVQLKELLKY